MIICTQRRTVNIVYRVLLGLYLPDNIIENNVLAQGRDGLTLINTTQTYSTIEPTTYCPKYPEPKNGQLECKQGRYCNVVCNAGYTPQYKPAQGYYCDQSIGRWMSFPEQDQIPWPDCVPRTDLR